MKCDAVVISTNFEQFIAEIVNIATEYGDFRRVLNIFTQIRYDCVMKHILYVITQTHYGGAAKYVRDLSLALNDYRNEPSASNDKTDEFSVTVAVGEGKEARWIKDLSSTGIEVIRLKHVKRNLSPWHDFVSGFELLKLYKKTTPDIIHLNSSKIGATGAVTAWLYKLITRRFSVKTIYTVHGLVLNEPLSVFHKAFYWFSEWFGAFFKDTLITVSEYDKNSLLKYHITPEKKIHVIHNGIDLTDAQKFPKKEQAKKLLNLDERITIGTIAGLYPTKGLVFALEAINSLEKSLKDKIHYVIIGRGPDREKLNAYIKQNKLAKTITLLGEKEDAQKYLKAFDVFVLPSVKEGLSYTLIEARSAGLPIITTNVGGNPEIITHKKTGLIVPSKNPLAIADAIKLLISDTGLSSLLSRNAMRNLREFSIEKMIAETIKSYDR